MFARLAQTVNWEQRSAVGILVAARWVLVVVAAFVVNYHIPAIVALIAGAALLNLALHLTYLRRSVPLWLPLLAALHDGAAVTLAVRLVDDGFQSSSYVLLYPALLAFSMVFPGRVSFGYGALVLCAYVAAIATTLTPSIQATRTIATHC